MTLIDTEELYSNGHSEELIGHAIAGQRDRVFLVSKVLPSHAAGGGIAHACEASLARVGTDRLDLYLLHWRERGTDLASVVMTFESLRAAGKIRAWGVSTYTPLGGGSLLHDPPLARIAAARGCSAAAVALAWVIRSGNVIAIPESGSPAHVKENAIALSLTLTPQELQSLDAAYPSPDH